MNATYITPFIRSAKNVFETMIQMPVEVGTPSIKQAGDPSYDVSGIIGMSGGVEGAVVLGFPMATAERIVSLFTGEEMTKDHEAFADAVGELVNMISGGAKAQFPGKQVAISCPSVVIGSDHVVFNRKDVVCISIPFSCDCGEFAVEVAMRQSAAAAPASAETGARTAGVS